jgi:MFS family permease
VTASAAVPTSAVARIRALPLWRPLAVRDFRLLWSGETVSLLGDQFHFVALAWLVLQVTGSGLALGTVLLASQIPRAVTLLVGGALSDRLPARSLLLASNLIRAGLSAGIALLIFGSAIQLWQLALIGVAFGIVDAIHMPAFRSLVPRTVDEGGIAPANALVESTMQLANLVGPPLAGLFVATVGIGASFGLDALSFVVAAFTVFLLTAGRRAAIAPTPAADDATGETGEATEAAPGMLESIRSGLGYVFGMGSVRTVFVVSVIVNFALNGPAAVGLPWLADQVFDAGSVGFGLLLGAWGAGALAGGLLCGATGGRIGSGQALLVLIALLGLGMIGVGLSTVLPLTLVVLAAMGVIVGYLNVLVISWFQRRTDPSMLGRLMSIMFLAGSVAGPFSFALSGVLVDTVGAGVFILSGALVLLTSAITALARAMPDFGPDAPAPATAAST